MLKPKKIKKARIVVLNSAVEKLVKDLHEAGVVEIIKSKYAGLEEGKPLSTFDVLSNELLKLRGIQAVLEARTTKKYIESSLVEVDSAIKAAKEYDKDGKIRAIAEEETKLLDAVKNLQLELQILTKLEGFGNVDFSKLTTKTLDYAAGEVQNTAKLRDKVGEHGNIIARTGNKVILVYSKDKQSNVDSALIEAGFTNFEVPTRTTTPKETIAITQIELNDTTRKLDEVKAELSRIAEREINGLRTLVKSLEAGSERYAIGVNFASSNHFQVLDGWVLEENFGKLKDIVAKYGSSATLEGIELSHNDDPPVVLNNPKIMKPFEFITKNYSLPNYFDFDPTLPYFIAMPIIYGMMVGDVGYGLLSIGIAKFFQSKFKKSYIMQNVAKIWLYSSIPSIIFGVIYDEWGGFPHQEWFHYLHEWGLTVPTHAIYEGFHRLHNVTTLIGITALFGVLHLTIALSMGAIKEWHHSKKHAMAKIAWMGVMYGALIALASQMAFLGSEFTIIGGILALISIIMLYITEGIIGIIELPSIMSNILSYTRIAAIGIVGLVIAELINKMLPTPEGSIIGLLVIPIVGLLHVANCFIAMFDSTIQGGRLNILEFRSKFLQGGRKLFSPFSLKGEKE
ncbi:MAG: V-type ATP synthase subunit I [Candidatus Bilamarchaeum sp.]|jgi:V/A-type H+-transporting ATPase subunit I